MYKEIVCRKKVLLEYFLLHSYCLLLSSGLFLVTWISVELWGVLVEDQDCLEKQDTFYLSINHQTQNPQSNERDEHTKDKNQGNSKSFERRKGQDKSTEWLGVTLLPGRLM